MRTMAVAVDLTKQRLISGFLDHVIEGRIATRWAVLEQSDDHQTVILRLFRSEKEVCEKQAYTLSKENFIGTERGSVKQYYKKTPARYWAIITVHDQTLLFQDSHSKTVSTFEKWDKMLKDFWNHQSWLVTPLKGPNSFINEKGLTLHINRASVCFAYLNPPRHYCRLYLDNIDKVSYDGTRLCFDVTKDDNSRDYYEVKTERERFASRITEVIENLLSPCMTITSPESTNSCPAEIQNAPVEHQAGNSHRLERLTLTPMPLPHQDRLSPDSSIDQSTGEDIHMDISSLFPNNNKVDSSNCLNKSSTGSNRSLELEVSCIPDIKIVPVPVLTASEECKPEHNNCKQTVPIIPPRTTSCFSSSGSATKSDLRPEIPLSIVNLQKGMSASTGKLHVLKSDQTWDSSLARRRPPDGSSTTRVTSAVQLPLPKPPIPTLPATVEKASWVRLTGQDDLDSIGDSISSIASQNSDFTDVTSMDITQSLSSLSSEEERCRSSSTESSHKSPIRKSALSLNGCSNPTNGLSKNPGYNRSFSVPTELPRNHPFLDPDGKCMEPDYQSTEQEYINVSIDSLGPKLFDMDDSLYLNIAHEEALYVNPPLVPPVNPVPVPPRHPHPPAPARPVRVEGGSATNFTKSCDSMELHEVLNAMLTGDEQGATMGLPLTVWLKFCLNCDIDRNSYSSNNWRGLAEQLGLSSSDIVLVDDYSRRYSKKPTQVVLSYWEKQAQPRRPFNKSELISMLHELDRQDLLDIVIQREKYTGAGAK